MVRIVELRVNYKRKVRVCAWLETECMIWVPHENVWDAVRSPNRAYQILQLTKLLISRMLFGLY